MLQRAASPSQIIVSICEGGLPHQMLLIQSEYRFRSLTLEEPRTDTVKYCQYGVSVMSCVVRLEEKVGEAPPVANGHSQNE